jgi:hypothetical protein
MSDTESENPNGNGNGNGNGKQKHGTAPASGGKGKKIALGVIGVLVLCALVAVGALALAGGGDNEEAAPETTTTTTTTTIVLAPLTGLEVDEELAERASIAVKLDNHPSARPQANLNEADVIYEEVVEGGLTRFMAIYQSSDASLLGPIRSTRAVDGKIVWPLGGYFSYSGGTEPNVELLREAPIVDIGACCLPDAYYRRRGRSAPHNLYSSTHALRDGAVAAGMDADVVEPPQALFSYLGEDDEFSGAGIIAVTGLDVVISEAAEVGWDYDSTTKTWQRTQNGERFISEDSPASTSGTSDTTEPAETSEVPLAVDNVVIQYVTYGGGGGDAEATGTGKVVVLVNGQMVEGTWTRSSVERPAEFKDSAGKLIKLKPGRTFVVLASTESATTTRATTL